MGHGAGPRAVVLDARAAKPEAGPGEALIRPLKVGVSPADILMARGLKEGGDLEPITLGHEFIGIVEKVARPESDGAPISPHETSTLRHGKFAGKRVVASPVISCARCELCRGGLGSHCRARAILGVHGRDGCLGELCTLPLANLHVVPDSVDDDDAVLALPLAGAIGAAQRVRIEGRPYVTVLGDTAPALLCAQVMAKLNASVRVLGASEPRFTLCERWGIKHRHVNEAGKRGDQDVVIECSGTPAGLETALRLVRPRGRVVLLGDLAPASAPAAPPPPSFDLRAAVMREIEIIGSLGGPIGEALHLLATRQVDTTGMITRRFKLERAVDALAAATRDDQVKVVIEI